MGQVLARRGRASERLETQTSPDIGQISNESEYLKFSQFLCTSKLKLCLHKTTIKYSFFITKAKNIYCQSI